jgi:hypothetical protein
MHDVECVHIAGAVLLQASLMVFIKPSCPSRMQHPSCWRQQYSLGGKHATLQQQEQTQ